MSSSPDNFERLLALLTLKRHERPPPRYFAEFPDRLMARLEREGGFHALPWWRRWMLEWELSPVVACSMGVVACTLLLAGLSYFFWAEPPGIAENPAADNNPLALSGGSLTPSSHGVNIPTGRPEFVFGSTNPTLNAGSSVSPFGGPTFRSTPVNYIPRNN